MAFESGNATPQHQLKNLSPPLALTQGIKSQQVDELSTQAEVSNGETLTKLYNGWERRYQKQSEEQMKRIEELEQQLQQQGNLEEELKKLEAKVKEEEECKICFEEKADTAFVECGHTSTCPECTRMCNGKCPICRKPGQKTTKIYKS